MTKRWLVVCAILQTACSLVTNLDGLTGGGAVDAGVDGSTSGEAGADGGAGFCASGPAHTFCDDFDETPLGAKWSATLAEGGTVGLDPDASVSPPNSLVAAFDDAGGGEAVLRKDFFGPATSVECEFDVRIDTLSSALELFNLALDTVDTSRFGYNVSLHQDPNLGTSFVEFYVDDGGRTGNDTSVPALPVGEWVHVAFSLSMAANPTVTIAFDDAGVLDASVTPPASNGGQSILFGTTVYVPSVTSTYHDNVFCDIH